MDAMTALQWNRWLDLGRSLVEALTEPAEEETSEQETSSEEGSRGGTGSYACQDRVPPSTEFEIACEFLDLSAKKPFLRADFEGRVREFRVLYHPDTKPEADRARFTRLSQRVAWSEQTIRRHRGW